MRTIEQIQHEILTAKQNESTLQELNSTSKVAVYRLWIYIVAVAIWSHEKLFEIFKKEITAEMAKNRIHNKEWYRQKALNFLFGFPMLQDTDKFDINGATTEQIATAKVVKQAACVKLISGNGYGILRVKVAGEQGGELVALETDKYNALKHYMQRYVVDAGTQMKVTTGPADDLLLKLDVYYNPLILSPSGERLDGTNPTPVLDAIKKYLKSIEFNGAIYIGDLIANIRKVEGVQLAKCLEARSKYAGFDYYTSDVQGVGLIDEIRIADAGYMKLDEDVLQINYKTIAE